MPVTQKAPTDLKRCPKCGETKVCEGNFYRARSPRQDGWAGYCRSCARASTKAWDEANPTLKAARSARHHRANPERRRKMRERLDRWARENPERAKASGKARWKRYVERHPDRVKAFYARFARSPKGKAAQKRHRETPTARERHKLRQRVRRRMLKVQVLDAAGRVGATREAFTVEDWRHVLGAFVGACAYCGRADVKLEMDHVIPVAAEGVVAHRRGNIVPACRSCNASKKDRPLAVFCAERGLDVASIVGRLE